MRVEGLGSFGVTSFEEVLLGPCKWAIRVQGLGFLRVERPAVWPRGITKGLRTLLIKADNSRLVVLV